MAWKSVSEMDQRREFVALAQAGGVSMAELCRRFGISRQTGYVLLRRVAAEGEAGLAPRSRRPRSSPRRTAAPLEDAVVTARQEQPAWGGRKIAQLLKDEGQAGVPAASTVTGILHRRGLIDPVEASKHQAWKRFERASPNELWQMDFKGHVAMDRGRCHPLTVLDDHSRYALGLQACDNEREATVKAQLTALFRRYGLPQAILCDNGAPWGAPNGMITALEVWLLRLGIRLYHGRPYHPQTQGKEERFHRTLKCELLQMRHLPDLPSAQAAFDAWRQVYNHKRPHQALGLATPGSRYQPSPRSFPETLPEPVYASDDLIRRVRADGSVSFKGRHHRVSQAFAGLDLAIRPGPEDGLRTVFFGRFPVATIDLRT